jgi:DNA polymerase-1
MSAFGLARQLGIERGEAQDYIDLYFARYPGVRTFMDKHPRPGARDRYVETLFGRRLYLTGHQPQQQQLRQRRRAHRHQRADAGHRGGHHQARDDPGRRLAQAERPPVRMIMQVHDELVFEIADEAH